MRLLGLLNHCEGIMEQESWEGNHRRASRNRHHGKGIMGEESWEEASWEGNHRREIMERGIMGGVMGEESWEEESWERNHGRGIMGRGSPQAPRRPPGGSQEAAKATKAPRGF